MWHIDTTVIRLLDGTRAYLQAVIDNSSRRILAWRVADTFAPVNSVAVLVDRAARDAVSDASGRIGRRRCRERECRRRRSDRHGSAAPGFSVHGAMYAQYERGSHFKRPYPPDLRKWHRALDGIREVAGWAADMGITLVLQNHAPVTTPGYEDALAMVTEIDRRNVKLCLDVPLFYERQDPAYVREAVHRCREHVVYTHYGAWNFTETPDGRVLQGPGAVIWRPDQLRNVRRRAAGSWLHRLSLVRILCGGGEEPSAGRH